MRPTLQQSAKLLAEPDAASRTRGATIAYELCLGRCVAPITPLASIQVALGRDYALLAPVLRRLGRALRVPPADKDAVDLVIASARSLAAVSALLVFAQRCDVDVAQLAHVAGPLRSRCAPALVVPLLATDLRVVAAARDALDQILLLRVAHQSPWLEVLLSLRSFRDHYTSSSAAAAAAAAAAADADAARADSRALLAVVLTRVSALLRSQFIETASRAEARAQAASAAAAPTTAADTLPAPSGVLRRRSSAVAAQPVRVSAMSSWHARAGPPEPEPRPLRFLDKIRRVRRGRGGASASTQSSLWRCEGGGMECNGCRFCVPSDPDSFGHSAGGMRFSNRGRRHDPYPALNSPVRRVSTDSTRAAGRRSIDGALARPRRESVNGEKVARKSSVAAAGRRKRLSLAGNNSAGTETSTSFSFEGVQPVEWNGERLGIYNRNISTGMHIYERLLSRVLLPSMQDRCQVIDDLHRLAQPMLTGVTAGASHVDAAAVRCTVANAFLTHGAKIYPALLALVFRPAPSQERTEQVKRHMSLDPELGIRNDVANARKSRRYRTADISEHIMGSMQSLIGKEASKSDRMAMPSQSTVCLPNSDCDTDTAMRCNALLTLLVTHVPNVCNPRLPLMTGATNAAYWHCAEALEDEGDMDASGPIAWSVERLVSAVDSLCLLNASLPDSTEDAARVVTQDTVELDTVVETCMRSVCSSGCRLARMDARPSATKLSDSGVVQAARAWAGLSKLPSQSVLWPSGPAYSSAIVFVAHLARRAALAAYAKQKKGPPPPPETPVVHRSRSSDPGLNDGVEYPVASGNRECEETDMAERLQECIDVLISRNGSGVVMHDLFRTLLYILGRELRGTPTRGAIATSGNVFVSGNENIIAGQSLRTARLPGRVPMFTRAAHSPARMALAGREFDHGEITGTPVSPKRASLEEHDMSGLLVGNIAVDGSRDNKLRDAAAKADASIVARWFAELLPPGKKAKRKVPNTKPANVDPYRTPERLVRTKKVIADPVFPVLYNGLAEAPEPSPPAPSTAHEGREVPEALFEELATSIALVLQCVAVATEREGEDLALVLDGISDDVLRAKSAVVTELHARAIALLQEARAGSTGAEGGYAALLRQLRELKVELNTLRTEFEDYKAAFSQEDGFRRQFWPLRSFPRNIETLPSFPTNAV